MTQLERKKKNKLSLIQKKEMISALIEEWSEICRKQKIYRGGCWAYVRDLKNRRKSIEIKIKHINI